MKLLVYKGFDDNFLSKLTAAPLYDNGDIAKDNILSYDKTLKRKLSQALLSMEDNDVRWATYEEYTFIKENIDLAVKDYELDVTIYVNNLYPDYYPIKLSLEDTLLNEIIQTTQSEDNSLASEQSNKFLSIYSSACVVNNKVYCSFYNFEYEKNSHIQTKEFYPHTITPKETTDDTAFSILINDDVESYLKDLEIICATKPRVLNYRTTKGSVSTRILDTLIAFCQHNSIELRHLRESIRITATRDSELVDIATNVIGIPNFTGFRKIKFYKNPDLSNEIVEISQSQVIRDIITQAENAFVTDGISVYRDIFITASTGAGKSVMFQIPAVYLAQKYNKLTIIIEPVKALMQDQKDQLNKRGYNRVEVFNSDLITQTEKEAVLKRVKSGEVDLLYLSPETLLSYSIETLIGDREIGLLIIDEAHIVTTWGVGFRPDYWYLGGYINYVRNGIKSGKQYNSKPQNFPICAFTATAVNGGVDDSVSETIISLYMENPIKYIGYAKRDNIAFRINKQELRRLPNSTYEQRKGTLLGQRVNEFVNQKQKTIAYFPYASYAYDAYRGVKSFAGISLDTKKVGLYTGSNRENKSVEVFNSEKREAFEKFRSGENTVMLATKAFGMGVDVDDIQNVYHYAVTGNLSDYVQEIGRAARKSSLQGYAFTDYFYNDLNFMKRLFGMSQIKQYQINMVLAGIYNAFKNKKESLSFLVSPESFTYIFGDATDEDVAINRLKTCLLMLEKDLYDKFNFKVLISRPRGVFTKAFVVIQQEHKDKVLASKYGRYFEFIAPGRDHEKRANGVEYSDCGDIYRIDLKSIWEEFNPDMSFPQFKYLYFNRGANDRGEVKIMPEICEYIFPRQRITIETKHDILLCDIREKILQDFEYIANELSTQFKRQYFSQKEFTHAISKKYGQTKAKIITNSLFSLVDPDSRCIKHRNNPETGEREYYISNGTFREYMRKHITGSVLLRSFASNHNVGYSQYVHFESDNSDAVALKLLSIFDYITYEIVGGEEPEIFIRLNDPEKIRRIVSGEIKYSNNYVTKARQKHNREVQILTKFFTELNSDEERWNYIEKYFLGEDLLANIVNDKEKEVRLSILIDKDKSYPTDQFETWLDMRHLFDDDMQPIIEEFSAANLPMPDYLETKLKGKLLSTEILMSWPDKNLLVFAENASDEEVTICDAKGWKYYIAHDLDLNTLRADLSKKA